MLWASFTTFRGYSSLFRKNFAENKTPRIQPAERGAKVGFMRFLMVQRRRRDGGEEVKVAALLISPGTLCLPRDHSQH